MPVSDLSAGRRVLLVLYKLQPGGAEHVALSLATGLLDSPYVPLVCALKDGPLADELRRREIPVVILDKSSRADPAPLLRLVRLLKQQNIHIIHTHSFSPNFWGRLAALIARTPVTITTEHTLASARTPLQRALDRALAPFTSKIIAVSDAVGRSLVEQEGIAPEKIITIYNGIATPSPPPPKAIRDVAASLGIDPGRPAVAIVGRLDTPKGHDSFLHAARLVADAVPTAQFLVIGDGPLMPSLRSVVQRIGLDGNVTFTGQRRDVPLLLALSTVAVLSSRREGFSIALLEYMAAGKPIVATSVGGNAEALAHGECGLLVPPDDPARLAEAVLALLTQPAVAERLALGARERFHECFSLERMVQQTIRLYDSLLHSRAAGQVG